LKSLPRLAMSDRNGAKPDRLARIADDLLTELALENAAVADAQAMLDEAKERRQKIQRALDALTGSSAKAKAKAPTKGQTPVASEAIQDQMRQAVLSLTEPKTVKELGELAGLREDTARRAIKGLRNSGEIRMTGKRKQEHGYPAQEFMPMPELMEEANAG
jgi:CRP-like cAMP-binding protein